MIPKIAAVLTVTLMLAGATASHGEDAVKPIEPILTDDGLYTQAWFLQSFLDLGEDLEEARAGGKRFAINAKHFRFWRCIEQTFIDIEGKPKHPLLDPDSARFQYLVALETDPVNSLEVNRIAGRVDVF